MLVSALTGLETMQAALPVKSGDKGCVRGPKCDSLSFSAN